MSASSIPKMQNERLSRSVALFERAQQVMPGGCSRNAILRAPHPFYAEYASGCTITDIEGVERIDFANNMASLIHGHADPRIEAAVTQQLRKGTAYNFGTEVEIAYAEHLISRSTSFEKLRFVNSGTEAIMACLKAGRAYTDRPKIAKVEGAYHGLYDYAEVSQTASPENWGALDRPQPVPVAYGTPQAALDDVVILPFNDLDRSITILNKQAESVACVLIDLMPHRVGVIPASEAFVKGLREWTRANNALLVYDEVITYRSTFGGAQEWHDIEPDLTAMGKMIGGGFPVGALAGRADVMDVMNPLANKLLFPHSGTFSANPITMTAGLAAMKAFDQKAVQILNDLADYARVTLKAAIKDADAPACVTGKGSMFKVHLRPTPPKSYREAYAGTEEKKAIKAFLDHLLDDQIILINSCAGVLSTPMTRATIDQLAEAVGSALKKTQPELDTLGERHE